jgi:arylsulfatase A-like enzyme
MAAWFGLAAGLLEACLRLALQDTPIVGWKVLRVDHNILWAAPGVNTVLFLLLALGLAPFLGRMRRWDPAKIATAILSAGLFYTLLSMTGRLRASGVAMLALGLGTMLSRHVSRDSEKWLRFLRRSVVPLALVSLLASLGALAGNSVWERRQWSRLPAPPPTAPNVLLIVVDTLRADHLGAYGYTQPTTPFLDDYARRSVLFEKAFSTSSWTLPAHASLFTGRLPYEHGAEMGPYDGRFPTLAEEMARHGFATVGIVANNTNGVLTASSGLARGLVHWENLFVTPGNSLDLTLLGNNLLKYMLPHVQYNRRHFQMDAEQVNRQFLRWLDARPPRPFFAFLNYMDVHAPYRPPYQYVRRFSTEPEKISSPRAFRLGRPYTPQDPEEAARLSIEAYDASLAYLDDQLQALFTQLRQRGLDNNLLVMITSDHGESFGEHGLFVHRNSLYREQIHIPLLVRLPGKTPEGKRVESPVGIHQVAATVAELAGLGSAVFPGGSLVSRWSNGPEKSDAAILAELTGGKFPDVGPKWPIYQGWLKSLITSRWHFILQQDGKTELYDWCVDPQEKSNLADAPGHKALVDRFRAQLEAVVSRELASPKQALR